MSDLSDLSLQERHGIVRDRIERAAARAGRSPGEVLLIAVTKKFAAARIREGYALGMRDFGENYVQEFEGKAPEVADLADARFHLIGHLQSNKARKAADIFQVVQTIDSVKLAQRLDSMEAKLEVLIDVKLSDEDAKRGASPADVPEIVDALGACRNLTLTGLMTMPPWSEDQEQSRPYFAQLRELAARHGLRQLSMGMSNDLEAAIEEGATRIRVGTALFGKRPKPA